MRLFHVSEQPDIIEFEPRIPDRNDLDKNVGLVWAIDDFHLSNFLTPRNCPRVGYHIGQETTEQDKTDFFSTPSASHGLLLEHKWYDIVKSTTLYIYEFDPADFTLQDAAAGYHVATKKQTPLAIYELSDLFSELIKRNVEIRLVDNLWHFADKVKSSTLDWSLCRMAYAQPKKTS